MTPEEKSKKIVDAVAILRARREKRNAEIINDASKKTRRFGKAIQKVKKRKRWFSRWRRKEKDFNPPAPGPIEKQSKERRGLFGRLREPGRFFSPERIKERHDFRVKVSGNRKWIMIGLAVVAVCGTIIYLSVTYGGGGFSFVTKFLGVFK